MISALGRHGKLRYSTLSRCLRVRSPATLVSTLRALEREGLLTREETANTQLTEVRYGLTPMGFSLFQSLLNMEYWFGR